MDGFSPVTLRAGAAALAVVLLTACGSGIQDGSPNRTASIAAPLASRAVEMPPVYKVSVAETMSLEEGLEMLDKPDAEVILVAMSSSGIDNNQEARSDLPDHAISWAGFPMKQRGTEFVVANFYPRPLRLNFICLVDGHQVPCSDDAAVWRVELDEPGMTILDLPEAEGRRDVLLVEESDERIERVYPTSRVRSIDGIDVPLPILGDPLPEIANPLDGGCDWALLRDDLKPRGSSKVLRTVGAAPVHLVISICPEHPSYEMFPIFIVDETTVVYIEGLEPFMARPGAVYGWQLPDELLSAGNKIRAAVVRRAPGWGFWVTHPLITEADPGG